MGGLVKVVVADAMITCMWVFCVSTLGILTSLISSAHQIQGLLIPTLLVTTSLVFLLVFVFVFGFGFISRAMGGASFNPTGTNSFNAIGLGGDSLYSIALRLPAQVST